MTQKNLPIKITEIRRLLNYYYGWYKTYDKECYQYVIEEIDLDENLKEDYRHEIISLIHTILSGFKGYKIKIRK